MRVNLDLRTLADANGIKRKVALIKLLRTLFPGLSLVTGYHFAEGICFKLAERERQGEFREGLEGLYDFGNFDLTNSHMCELEREAERLGFRILFE